MRWRPSGVYNHYLDLSENIPLHHRRKVNRFGLCRVSNANLTRRHCGVYGILTYGRRGRNQLSKVIPDGIWTFDCCAFLASPESTAVRDRLRRWAIRMYRSCRRVVTRGRPLLSLSCVVPVWPRRRYRRDIVYLLILQFCQCQPETKRLEAFGPLRWFCVKSTMFYGQKLPEFQSPNAMQYNMPMRQSYCVHLMYWTDES